MFLFSACTTLKEPVERQNLEERQIEEIVARGMIQREARSKMPKNLYLELSPSIQKKLIKEYAGAVTIKEFNQFRYKHKGLIADKETGELGAVLSVSLIDFDVSDNIFLKEANLNVSQVDAVAIATVYIGPMGIENYYYYLKRIDANWVIIKYKIGTTS